MSLATAAKVVAGAAIGAQAVTYALNSKEELLRPPGSPGTIAGEAEFSSRCIRCGKCIEACPYEAIYAYKSLTSPSAGMPTLDPRSKACSMCHDVPCVPVCPTGALHDVTKPEEIDMGYAILDHEICISFKGLRCEVCYRACPLIDRAITIDYRVNENDSLHSVFAPIISEEDCTGCGLCVERCITDEPAIRIVREGWELRESESDDWVPSARENLSGPRGEGVWM